MRVCYILLSPTWGMHQYTADLANRRQAAGDDVHLISTRHIPRDRYAPAVTVHTPVAARGSGLSLDGAHLWALRSVRATIRTVAPDLVHVTGPHLWNPLLLRILRGMGVPTVHTVHDLHPHIGTRYGKLLYLWNGWVRRGADHLLVHGQCYRNELVAQGMPPRRVTCTPLTHLFVGHALGCALSQSLPDIRYEPWALFFARLEAYKGLDVLVEAAWRLDGRRVGVVIAGPGRMRGLGGSLPDHIDVRDRLIGDEEAVDLFRRCGLVVLPYSEASQSALIAAAYYFRKPVIVTRAGALPEYVMEGETGWVIPARNPSALAERLQRALNDPEQLAHMGRAGRAWYDQQRQAEGLGLQEMYVELVRPLLRAQAAAQREG